MKKRIVFKNIDISDCPDLEELVNKDTIGIKTYTFTEEERKRIEKDFNDGTLEALFEKTIKEDGSEFPNIKKDSEDRKNKSKLMINNTKKNK